MALGVYLLYAQTFGRPLPSINKKKGKEIEMNFIDRNELDLTYYDIDLFGGLSEKTDYLMNDGNTATKLCFLK